MAANSSACYMPTPKSSTPIIKQQFFQKKVYSSRGNLPNYFKNGTLTKSSNNDDSSSLPLHTDQVIRLEGTAGFHPSVWDGHFLLSNACDDSSQHDTFTEGRIKELKKQVMSLLCLAYKNHFQELDLIDKLQRLGIAYHFEKEISEILQRIYVDGSHGLDQRTDDCTHLHFIALRFRLLRQAGYYVSPDVFNNFKYDDGEFKSNLSLEVHCLLSLYEASYLGFNEEYTMDKAMSFATKHLKSMMTRLSTSLASEVQRALQIPLQKDMERVHARHYISTYQADESHNKLLLEFASLDFNRVQLLHQNEVGEVKRWWDALDIKSKLPFEIRDRVVEGYCMLLATYFEPRYSTGRILLAKIFSMLSVLDDAFDVYGNLDELVPLTDAFQRWNVGDVNDDLPEHMKIIFVEVLNIINGVKEETITEGQGKRFNSLPYLKQEVKNYTKGLLEEAEILFSGDIPSLEDWLPISMVTVAINIFVVAAVMYLEESVATKEVFDWIVSKPKMIRCSYMLNRLFDDIATFKGEQERGILLSTVTCCMKDHGMSESDAIKKLQGMITSSWKEMNQERCKPHAVPQSVVKIIFNITAIIEMYYVEGVDGYTNSNSRTRDIVAMLLIDPIPV